MSPSEVAPNGPGTPASHPPVHRLGHLLGFAVVTEGGRALGHVNDVRLAPGHSVRGTRAELLVEGFVVGTRHAGSLLGYDRRGGMGPWLLRRLVRWLHRHAGYVAWEAVRSVDWGERRVVVRTETLAGLTTSS
jgi:hypothetical protein